MAPDDGSDPPDPSKDVAAAPLPTKADPPGKVEKVERYEKSDRLEKVEKNEKPERPERPDRPEPAARQDKPDISETLRQRLEALVPDLVRRTFTAGLGAVFSTEEGIRRITRELQLPSVAGNVAGYIADTADNTKDKVLEIVAREVRDFLAHVNLSEEVARLLTTLSFEIKTEIRFIPNSERYTGVDPDVKAAVRLKRVERDKEKDRERAEKERERERERDKERAEKERDRERDRDKDDPGRLRRLWRRATEGNNGTTGPGEEIAEVIADDPLDRSE